MDLGQSALLKRRVIFNLKIDNDGELFEAHRQTYHLL